MMSKKNKAPSGKRPYLMALTVFQQRVYHTCRKIPAGQVATYADLARAIGRPRASRAVGSALRRNPFAPQVPCHRIVRSSGKVGQFARGLRQKRRLLQKEGIIIKNSKIDLEKYRYRLT